MKTIGIAAALLLVGGGGYFGYAKWKSASEAESYILQKIDRGDIVRTVAATGTVEPLVKVIIGSQVSGNIIKWHADFNDPVKEGMVLAEIDPQRFEMALAQAKAEQSMALANEEQARVRHKDTERERKRLDSLMAEANASENEMLIAKATEEGAKAAWHAAQAAVESAEARVQAAQVDLDRTILRCPIDGVVISRDIDVGMTVAASFQSPTLFTIANDLKRMQVNANVSEAEVGLIKEGMAAKFRVDAFPLRDFVGRISQIRYNATVVDNVVTYVTLIEVENDDLALRPGMTANVTFEVARADDVLRVPTAALRFRLAVPSGGPPMGPPARGKGAPPGPTIYQLVNGKPAPRSVKIGLSDSLYSELIGGELSEGSEIIIDRNWSSAARRPPDLTAPLRRG